MLDLEQGEVGGGGPVRQEDQEGAPCLQPTRMELPDSPLEATMVLATTEEVIEDIAATAETPGRATEPMKKCKRFQS